MKKLLLLVIFLISSLLSFASFADWWCWYSEGATLSDNLKWCLQDSALVSWSEDLKIDSWFKDYIVRWTNNISLYLWIFSVLGIVLWSFNLVSSAWKEDKITKAKNVIKWSIVWFIWVITSALIINLIVKIMFSSALNGTSIILLWN